MGVLIRMARKEDEAAWLAIRNDPEACFWSHAQAPIDPLVHTTWFAHTLNNPADILHVAEVEGTVVGYGRVAVARTGTVSFGVTATQRGRGIGQGLLATLDAAAQGAHITQQAWVHPSNIPSMLAFLRAGYQLGGKLGYQHLVKP